MKGTKSIGMLFLAATAAFAGETMNVAICNMGQVPAAVLEHAEAEAAYVFQSVGVEIRWTNCGAEVDSPEARMRPDFIVRARDGGHINKVGRTSLEAMGRAFVSVDGTGRMADVYYGAIRELTLLWPITSADQVMGYTMAHELGHLLGARHRPNGLMRPAFGKKELDALNQRRLKFNDWERATIMQKLGARKTASAANALINGDPELHK